MSTTTYAWAPITKTEDLDDGTLMVYGPAADAGLDRDGQRLNQTWLDSAMPAWMAEGGNVREQHDGFKAAGVAVGLTRSSDGVQNIAAHIVDPITVKKLRAKVLKGFSVGIKEPRIAMGKADAPNGEIVGGFICEVSVCDRPSNPRMLLTIAKADGAGQLAATPDAAFVEVVGTDDAAQAEQILADLAALVPAEQLAAPALAKADTADIATAMEATAAIARLIQSEAQDLAAGDLTETCEIGCLLDAMRALKYFIAEEQAENRPTTTDAGEQVADDFALAGDVILMADEPTTTKTDAPDGTKADGPDATKSGGAYLTKADLQTMLDGAVQKATEPLGDRLKTVEAELVKALQAPAPGGPVQTRTAVTSATTPDLRAQAHGLLAKAAQIGNDDPSLAQGYRDRAAVMLAKADA